MLSRWANALPKPVCVCIYKWDKLKCNKNPTTTKKFTLNESIHYQLISCRLNHIFFLSFLKLFTYIHDVFPVKHLNSSSNNNNKKKKNATIISCRHNNNHEQQNNIWKKLKFMQFKSMASICNSCTKTE